MQHVAVSQPSTTCKTLPSNGCYDGEPVQVAAREGTSPTNGREDGHRLDFDASTTEDRTSCSQPETLPPNHPSDSTSATILSPHPSTSKHVPRSAGSEPPSSIAIGPVNGAAASVYVNSVSSVVSPVTIVAPIPQKANEGSPVGLLNFSRRQDTEEEEEGDSTGAALPPPPSPTRLTFSPHSQFEPPGENAQAHENAARMQDPGMGGGPQRLTGPVLTSNLDPASVDLVTQRMHKVMGEDDDLDRRSIYHQPPKAADRGSAARLAKRLFHLDGFRLGDVFKHLCKKNDFSQLVGEEYLNFFDFTGERLDMALRSFLSKFTLMGETQERERVLAHYSRRFMQCNPESYNSEDACHTLVCAMMLLNTDLHGHNVLRKMSCQDFIGNLAELNNGQNFEREELKTLYEAIKEEPLQWPQEILPPQAVFGPQNMSEEARRILSGGLSGQNNPFLEVPNPNDAQEYRRSYLHRKCVMDAYGKKTALGKRKWKLVFVVHRDLILYLYKNEESVPASFGNVRLEDSLDPIPPAPGSPAHLRDRPAEPANGEEGPAAEPSPPAAPDSPPETAAIPAPAPAPVPAEESRSSSLRRQVAGQSASVCGAIRIHHSLAAPASDYTKRQHVLRLTTADGAEFLLQANSAEGVSDWCYSINYAAARLSAAPMAAAVGSDKGRDANARWHRPLLPAFYTQCNTRDQLEQHQKRVLDFTHARQEHGQKPPKKSDKGRAWQEFNEKKAYLDFELERYKTYARILERQLAMQFTQPGPVMPGEAVAGGDMMNQLSEENGALSGVPQAESGAGASAQSPSERSHDLVLEGGPSAPAVSGEAPWWTTRL